MSGMRLLHRYEDSNTITTHCNFNMSAYVCLVKLSMLGKIETDDILKYFRIFPETRLTFHAEETTTVTFWGKVRKTNAADISKYFCFYFPRKWTLIFHANFSFLWIQSARNVKVYFRMGGGGGWEYENYLFIVC